jgi:hypothetical protein
VEQLVRLQWHVDLASDFPIAMNPGLRLNDMQIVGTHFETEMSTYSMFRGSGLCPAFFLF